MRNHPLRSPTVRSLLLAALVAVSLVSGWAAAAGAPLRTGEIVAVASDGYWTYIRARDAAGKEFWVWMVQCTVGEGGHVDVLQGRHYQRVQAKGLGLELEDCYIAQLLRLNGQEVRGLAAHGLPDGCIVLKE